MPRGGPSSTLVFSTTAAARTVDERTAAASNVWVASGSAITGTSNFSASSVERSPRGLVTSPRTIRTRLARWYPSWAGSGPGGLGSNRSARCGRPRTAETSSSAVARSSAWPSTGRSSCRKSRRAAWRGSTTSARSTSRPPYSANASSPSTDAMRSSFDVDASLSPRSIEPSRARSRNVLSARSSSDQPTRFRAAATARPISCASTRDLYHVRGEAGRVSPDVAPRHVLPGLLQHAPIALKTSMSPLARPLPTAPRAPVCPPLAPGRSGRGARRAGPPAGAVAYEDPTHGVRGADGAGAGLTLS